MTATNQNPATENNNPETTDFDALAKNALAQNEELIYSQVNSLINTYFTTEQKPGGGYYYRPVMVAMEMEQQVVALGDPNVTPPVMPSSTTIITKFKVPQLTMAPLSFLAVKSGTVDNNGKMELTLGQVPVPKGVNILIEALANTISPVSETVGQ